MIRLATLFGFAAAAPPALAQSSGHLSWPRPLPEAEEVALAMSAAPREISSAATIYVLRASGPAKAREGTNGCTCMVARDLHEGSLYPICFDQEASATVFRQELLELRLRFEGKSEAEVKRAVAAAYAKRTLRPPARPAISYMMSPHQVLFTSPLPEGRRVGAWHPHLMISLPNATQAQLGLAPQSGVDFMQLERSGEPLAQLIVQVPHWSDATPAAAAAPSLPAGAAANPAARETLRLAERRVSETAHAGGLSQALPPALASDAVLLLEGAPLVRGRDAIAQLLQAQTALRELQLSWIPFRVIPSGDGSLGVTFGSTTIQRSQGNRVDAGRYMTVWRRGDAGAWQIVAHAQIGLLTPEQLVLPAGLAAVTREEGSNAFAAADLAFAKMAGDSGAPAAFARHIAPDGMTLAGTGELNIGPAAVRARMAEGRLATAHWQWHPVITFAAASGELGATIGEAEIRAAQAPASDAFYSKYLTIWLRQPDGSLKFLVDWGGARPRPSP